MANQECLDTILQGAAAWNHWRNNQERIYFDLSGADLSHMDLRAIDLSGVYLHHVNLRNTDLSGANLYRAYLSEANLIDVRLDDANLNMANLHQATLDNASLCGANLSEADLREAQMHSVQAEKAIFRGADLSQANLSEADLRESDLHEVRINDAQLNGANLSRCDLRTLDLGDSNLSSADLQHASLQHARLSGASLDGANLNDANLEEADLNSAYLGDAHMRRAYLRCADLSFADLSGAVLSKADLSGADLLRTNFTNTNLSEANFTQAAMGWTIFGNVDLSTTSGLSTVRHHGTIILDIDTLFRSVSNIPESFLQAANLPLDIATRLSATPSPDLNTYCICAASIDQEFAARLHADLQGKGIHCWYVLADLKVEEKQQELLDELIRLHDHIFLVLSEHSINSEWMTYAIKTIQYREQRENKKLLLSIRLDNTVVNSQSNGAVNTRLARNVVDFISWRDEKRYRKAFTRLLRNLDTEGKMSDQRAASRSRQRTRTKRSRTWR